jgi:serine/threonine protein kinase
MSIEILKSPVTLETAFGVYTLTEKLGEGGSGRVYGGKSSDEKLVAVKVLGQVDTDKRKRFKNEIAFQMRNAHENIVTVSDHGLRRTGKSWVLSM